MKYDNLNQEYTRLKQSVGLCSEELQLYHDLETAGFDLEKLKVLSNIVKDISKANNIPEDQARQKIL